MLPEYTVEAADGFYIARNGEGVLDLADPQDYDFAELVCSALNQIAELETLAKDLDNKVLYYGFEVATLIRNAAQPQRAADAATPPSAEQNPRSNIVSAVEFDTQPRP